MNSRPPCICQLPDNDWIDLTLIRNVEAQVEESEVIYVKIYWISGGEKVFRGEAANVLYAAWQKYAATYPA
jgi:hypothetical protein